MPTSSPVRVIDAGDHDLRNVFADYPDPVYFDLVTTNEAGATVVARAMYGRLEAGIRNWIDVTSR